MARINQSIVNGAKNIKDKTISGATNVGSTTMQKVKESSQKIDARQGKWDNMMSKGSEESIGSIGKDTRDKKVQNKIRDNQKKLLTLGIKSLLESYSLDQEFNGSKLYELPTKEFSKKYEELISSTTVKARREIIEKASSEFIPMVYIFMDSMYRETWLYSYIKYTHLTETASMLSACTNQVELESNREKIVTTLENFLTLAESNNSSITSESFVLIKILLAQLISGNLLDASILARFIYTQFLLSVHYLKDNPKTVSSMHNNIFTKGRDESDLKHLKVLNTAGKIRNKLNR